MSRPLFIYFIKKNWAIWAGFTAYILFELVVCIFMMEQIAEMLPEGFMGIQVNGESTLLFIGSLIPTVGCLFAMPFYILISYRTVYRPIDTTSINTHLSSGMKRTTYLTTAALFLAFSLFMMFFAIFLICGLSMLIWGAFNWGIWTSLLFNSLLVNLTVAFISFFFAAAFTPGNIGKLGMIGLPILLLLLFMLSDYIPFLQYLTPFGWLDFDKLVLGTLKLWWLWDMLYIAITGTMVTLGIILFKKKQLSI